MINWQRAREWGYGWLLAVALASCGDPQTGNYVGDVITRTDFEDLAGWGTDVSALTREHAHSGRFATFVGPGREFSLTYKLPLGAASVHPVKAVEVEAWVYLPSAQADATLLVQVLGTDGRPLFNEGLHLPEQLHEYAVWKPVQHTFVLPPNLPLDSELRLYLWGANAHEPVYLDDLTAKARE